jgi:hypothetical protein
MFGGRHFVDLAFTPKADQRLNVGAVRTFMAALAAD